jgi:hypothetical protein
MEIVVLALAFSVIVLAFQAVLHTEAAEDLSITTQPKGFLERVWSTTSGVPDVIVISGNIIPQFMLLVNKGVIELYTLS